MRISSAANFLKFYERPVPELLSSTSQELRFQAANAVATPKDVSIFINEPTDNVARESLFKSLINSISSLAGRVQQFQRQIRFEHVMAGTLSTIPYISINVIFNGFRVERFARQFLMGCLQGGFLSFIANDVDEDGVKSTIIALSVVQLGCNTLGSLIDGFSSLTTISTHVTKAALWVLTGAYCTADGNGNIKNLAAQLTVLTFLVAAYESVWCQEFQTVVIRSLGHVAMYFGGVLSCHAIKLMAKTAKGQAVANYISMHASAKKIVWCMAQVLSVATGAIAFVKCHGLFNWRKVDDWMAQAIVGGFFSGLCFNEMHTDDRENKISNALFSSVFTTLFYSSFKVIGLGIDGFSYATTISAQVSKAASFVFLGGALGILSEWWARDGVKKLKTDGDVLAVSFFLSVAYEYLQCDDGLKIAVNKAFNNIALAFAGIVAYHVFSWIKKPHRTSKV